MSNLKKCDRCRAIYTTDKGLRISIVGPSTVDYDARLMDIIYDHDLCDECLLALRAFFAGSRQTKKED